MSKPAQIIFRSCFQTSDGSIFLTEAEALQHQATHDGAAWYECNKLYGNYAGSHVEFNDLVEWLRDNWAMAQTLAAPDPPASVAAPGTSNETLRSIRSTTKRYRLSVIISTNDESIDTRVGRPLWSVLDHQCEILESISLPQLLPPLKDE